VDSSLPPEWLCALELSRCAVLLPSAAALQKRADTGSHKQKCETRYCTHLVSEQQAGSVQQTACCVPSYRVRNRRGCKTRQPRQAQPLSRQPSHTAIGWILVRLCSSGVSTAVSVCQGGTASSGAHSYTIHPQHVARENQLAQGGALFERLV
jgi:hypothetical protein